MSEAAELGATPVELRALTAPRSVLIDGERAVVWTDADGERRAATDVCPHRRAPLSAGTVVDGVLRCPYHGWGYDGTGRCTSLPAVGTGGRIPPRAQLQLLAVPDELVDAPPVDEATHPTNRAAAPDPALDADADPDVRFLDGDTAGLDRFWHPVARLHEVSPPDGVGAVTDVELLGRTWHLGRSGPPADDGGWTATATDGTRAWGLREHLDHLWLAPLEPLAPLPVAAEWGAPGWHHRRLERAEGRFGVGLLIDNQLDAGHFPFVHAQTFGTPAGEAVPPAEIVRTGTVVVSTMRIAIAGKNDPLALAGERAMEQHRVMHYEYHAPLWLRLRLDYEDMGGSTVILFGFVPLGAGRARVDIDLLFQQPGGFTDEQLDERCAFEERVIAEDLGLQRCFDDLRLPLDPTVEVHTKADRLSLQCRQVLREVLVAARADRGR